MESFTIIHFILFLGISQGIFLAIAIQCIHNRNRLANRMLSLILIIAAIMLTGRFFFTIETNTIVFFRLALFVDILVFVFGPLLYLYYRRLVFHEKVKYTLHYVNFIPAMGMLAYHIWTYQYSYEEFVLMVRNGRLMIPFFIIETVGIVFNLYFCYRCFLLIKVYQKEEKKYLSYAQDLVPYLIVILMIVLLFLILWVVSYVLFYFLGIYSSFISYNVIWVAIPLFVYIVGFYSLKQPDIFRMPRGKKNDAQNRERVEGKALQDLQKNLEHLMVHEKIYLDHKLTLTNLAKQLNTSTNNLSWLLNNIHESSFYDFINKYRVEAFIEKIEKGEHQKHTILALSLDSGFNSKSTFNKAFKAVLKDTPSNYVKKLKAV
ncbi:helix-turn-helix domain-containing protein [Aquimarina sp. 2304DJ70-9]|uniref:helix-turn-helix domain-containing protein n=1 Tax=Aquimarina penaris TaxID=3231044 RepID=UPI00346334E8